MTTRPGVTQSSTAGRAQNRKVAQSRRKEAQKCIEEVFLKYDVNRSGTLDSKQLTQLLTELNKGSPPSAEERDFILNTADGVSGNKNKEIDKNELMVAIDAWKSYVDNKELIHSYFDKYDTNRSGVLERDQLQKLLTDLDEGKVPKDEDINYILYQADRKDGKINRAINKHELMYAIALWYVIVDEEKHKVSDSGCEIA
mmetsp:Transcript_13459/g.18426  ORF Transcript_13459/g.18426 Transcript_13459/m.18426 type:complete len:199 (-) Transcript_13459:230-826(-)|eukprot:CAMPEP_0196595486 /NCGR_PEP_ID=MMETSP1081-20130531/81266_1 /TAXON_ID=36882 /ORGANISM="Pyramimonas amylifera, Strain CCMP720" /LENGTH=198 /DNA_ID=CAMNT_0041920081 /DNA_START=95 /DNA_END=691 /DNA_ORIENTATION=-